MGQAILGVLSPSEVRKAIATEDVDALVVVPGVGRRSAQKLVLELKPKLDDEEASVVSGRGSGAELRQALEGLGYSPAEIREAIAEVDRELPVREQIRSALRLLSRR
jgi:Holliday junction DNA helicase RuvA